MGDVAPTSGNNTGSRLALPPRSFGPDAEPELPTGPRLGAADRPETWSCRPARDSELPTGPRLGAADRPETVPEGTLDGANRISNKGVASGRR